MKKAWLVVIVKVDVPSVSCVGVDTSRDCHVDAFPPTPDPFSENFFYGRLHLLFGLVV